MNSNSPYKELIIDTPIVCILNYKIDKRDRVGISIRYYAGDKDGDHQLFASGKSKDNPNDSDKISFSNFTAIIKVSEFDFALQLHDLQFYLDNYKVK